MDNLLKNEITAAESPDARSRLINAALSLFAEKGFKATSTREICEAAGANLSAIRYYFGDKAGLYRAVFTDSTSEKTHSANFATYLELPLTPALLRFFTEFLEPLKKGEEIRKVMKLHFREMIEPTGILQQERDSKTKPQHDLLVAILKKHLNLSQIDADVQRLAFAILGMAVYFYVGQEVIYNISPPVLETAKAIDILAERLTHYAASMIEGEARRRIPL